MLFAIPTKAQKNLDSLYDALQNHIDKTGYDSVTYRLSEDLFHASININSSNALEFGAICLKSAREIGDSVLIAHSLNLRGLSFIRQRNFFMATEAFFGAYEIYIKYNDPQAIAYTLLNIGNAYLEQRFDDIGQDKITEAMRIYKQIGDSVGVADCYVGIGKFLLNNEEKDAKKFFMRANEIYIAENQDLKLASTYNLLAIAYNENFEVQKSIDYLTQALTIFEEKNNIEKKAETYFILGNVYFSKENFRDALKCYNISKDIFSEIKSVELWSQVMCKVALTNNKLQNYDEAKIICNKIVGLKNNNLYVTNLVYKILADAYEATNERDSSLKYNKLHEEALVKYYEDKNSRNFSAFQMNLEIESIEQEINYLKIKNEKERLLYKEKQNKRSSIFISIIAFLCLMYLIFMFFRARERKKANESLQQTNILLKKEINIRKKAELVAHNQETRYKLLFQKTPIGIIQFDQDLIITEANERFFEIFNRTEKDILNKHINRILDRRTVERIGELINSKEGLLEVTTEIPTKKEVIFVALTIKKYSTWANKGEISSGIIILEDLTEYKKAERYYKTNILAKQKVIKQLPDDLLLLDKTNNIIEIHFPDAPEREIGVTELDDVFGEKTANIFKSHLLGANKNKINKQFFFSDGQKNYLARIYPAEDTTLIIISHFEAEAEDAGIIVKSKKNISKTNLKDYMRDMQQEIENELLPAYQNIQTGLSFIMIKSFAEKIIEISRKYNNKKLRDYGDDLFEYVTSFNIVKVNNQLEEFPSVISEFMGIE